MQEKGTDQSNSGSVPQWLLEVGHSLLKQEECWDQDLNAKDNEALLKGETLLQWGAALGHVGAYGVVVNIRGKLELQGFVKFLLDDHNIHFGFFEQQKLLIGA